MFGVHPDKVTPEQRSKSKLFMYGACYGAYGKIKLI